jgi:membrane protein
MKPRAILLLIKETARQWYAHDTFQLGAALAFYTVFSMAPVLIIAIGIAAVVFGQQAAQERVIEEIEQTLGSTIGEAIRDTMQYAHNSHSGVIATIIGVSVLLFGATSVFAQLQTALNTIWGVKLRPDSGIWNMVKGRLLSFAIVLAIGFLLLVSLVVSAALAALDSFLTPASHPGGIYLWQVLNGIISFGFITLLFAMIYKILPDVRIAWRHVWVGAAVTALLFTAGKFLIGLYLGRSTVTSSYGAAGSLVVVLLWVYYSSQIFLFGAEFTRVYTERSGTPVMPTEKAVRIPEQIHAGE